MGVALQSGRAVLVGTAEWADPDYDFAVLRLEGSLIFADGSRVPGAIGGPQIEKFLAEAKP